MEAIITGAHSDHMTHLLKMFNKVSLLLER